MNHIRNVLRMKPGEEIAVSNGIDGREYRCGIETFTENEVICSLRFIKEDAVELPARIYLFQGLPKADKMELIIQKAVELGAYQVIPVAAARCVVKLDGKRPLPKRPLAGDCGGRRQAEQKGRHSGSDRCVVFCPGCGAGFENGCGADSL